MRLVRTVMTALLLISLLATLSSAQMPRRLVTVAFDGWRQLEELTSLGLQILNYQNGVVVALASDGQIAALRSSDWLIRVLDAHPEPDSYYLAYIPDGVVADALSGLVYYSYHTGVKIVRASASEAAALSTRNIGLVKLPRSMKIAQAGRAETAIVQSTLGYSADVQTMVDAVSRTVLTDHVCKLQDDDGQAYCNALGTRYSFATDGLTEATEYLKGQLSGYGLVVTEEAFTSYGYPMSNVVAELPGMGSNSNHIVILCAHYDSTSRDPFAVAPGADDNGSGTAGVLEVARILSQHTFDRTIRFVLFAGEEQGLLGSAYYANQAFARGDVIDGVINLDMIGYETVPPGDHIVEVHAGLDPASNALADAMIANVTEYGIQLEAQKITSGATNRSDHASFWNVGYPAVLGIEDFQDFNPYYHSASDTLSNLQVPLMVEYTRVCVATVAELAGEWSGMGPTATTTPSQTQTPTATLVPTHTTTPTATPATSKQNTVLLPLITR